MRKEFKMTDEQHKAIMDACRPVPLIMLQCGMPPSQQETANRAWRQLGKELGFDGMSVRPVSSKGDRYFTAEVKSSPPGSSPPGPAKTSPAPK